MYSEIATIQYNGWQVREILGQGASARVFRAVRNDEVAALKVFDPSIFRKDEEAEERLNRQKDLIGHNIPGLIKLYEVGVAKIDGTDAPALMMELVAGQSLDKPATRNILTETQIRKIACEVARTAKALADLSIAHRDIKPANIMFDAESERVTLLDTGVIRPLDAADVSGHAFVGTRRYSPCEFLYRTHQNTQDAWNAITYYQICATLYEITLKIRPYSEIKVEAQLTVAIRDQSPSFELLNAVHADMRRLIKLGLRRDWRTRLKGLSWDDFEAIISPTQTGLEVSCETAAALAVEAKKLSSRQKLLYKIELDALFEIVRRCLLENGKPVVRISHPLSATVLSSSNTTSIQLEPFLEIRIHGTTAEFALIETQIASCGTREFYSFDPQSQAALHELIHQKALELI